MTTTLRVISRYRNGAVDWQPGRIEVVSDSEAAAYLRDSPGSFQVVDPAGLEAAEAAREAALVEAYGEPPTAESPEEVPEADGSDVDEEPSVGEGDDLDDMTVDELRAIASDEDIDLTGRRAKADIVEAIRASRTSE